MKNRIILNKDQVLDAIAYGARALNIDRFARVKSVNVRLESNRGDYRAIVEILEEEAPIHGRATA